MNSLDDAPPEKRDSSKQGMIVVTVMIIGLIFYVFSPLFLALIMPSGPPASGPRRQVLEIYFAPLIWLHENVEIVQRFYDFLFSLFNL